MNDDVFGGIIVYGGKEGSFLFNMVCKSWAKVHGEKKKYTTTSAIMTSPAWRGLLTRDGMAVTKH